MVNAGEANAPRVNRLEESNAGYVARKSRAAGALGGGSAMMAELGSASERPSRENIRPPRCSPCQSISLKSTAKLP